MRTVMAMPKKGINTDQVIHEVLYDTKEIIKPLGAILNYMEETERRHFEESSSRERRSHIYSHMMAVRDWLNEFSKKIQ